MKPTTHNIEEAKKDIEEALKKYFTDNPNLKGGNFSMHLVAILLKNKYSTNIISQVFDEWKYERENPKGFVFVSINDFDNE